ncbi:unnamed protein product [Agarophyton chilense]
MITTERAKNAVLSQRASQLQSYIQCHKSLFRPGNEFSSTTATLFRKNDTARTLTPLDELATNAQMLPGGSVAATILVHIEDIEKMISEMAVHLNEAIKPVFESNMRLLTRIVSYGIAAGSADFVHKNNAGIMKLLHEEVGIETPLVESTLYAVRDLILERHTESQHVDLTNACFNVVIQEICEVL